MPPKRRHLEKTEELDAGALFERMMEPRAALTLGDVEPSPMGPQLGNLIAENGTVAAPILRAFWTKICDLLEQPPEERSPEAIQRLVEISRTELARMLQTMIASKDREVKYPHFFKYLKANHDSNVLAERAKLDKIVIDLYKKIEAKYPDLTRRKIASDLGINAGQFSNYLRSAGPLNQEKAIAIGEYCAKLLTTQEA